MMMSEEVFQVFRAVPDRCNAMMSRSVPEEEAEEKIAAYCDECEGRHGFAP